MNPRFTRRHREMPKSMVETALTGPQRHGTLRTVPTAEHPGPGVERAPGPGRISPVRNVAEVILRWSKDEWRIAVPMGSERDSTLSKPTARGAEFPQRMREASRSKGRQPKGKGKPITRRIGPRTWAAPKGG